MSGAGTGETVRLFARFVERSLGLHFPADRLGELASKMLPLCRAAGFDELDKYLLWLMAAPLSAAQQEAVAGALTIGETYFLRDPNSFRALEQRLLPPLLAARRKEGRRLRIWSAGCSSGEEPYTIAILLSRLIPDLGEWQLTLVGTDLNPQALEKARKGIYSQWSFRNAPDWLMEYFTRRPDRRYELSPRIRKLVSFSQLNLADPQAISALGAGGGMDIIFCRNVMLYFDAERIASTMTAFHQALAEGGWLLVGATELHCARESGFVCRHLDGALLLQKVSAREPEKGEKAALATGAAPRQLKGAFARAAAGRGEPAPVTPLTAPGGAAPTTPAARLPLAEEGGAAAHLEAARPAAAQAGRAAGTRSAAGTDRDGSSAAGHAEALELYGAGRYREAAERGARAALTGSAGEQAESLALAARAYANLGELARARECCERALACERLSAPGHYLLAVILEHQGELEGAMRSLKHALFIDHDYLLAYFALGNLHRLKGERPEAERNFANALRLLERRAVDEVIEEAEGLTAGRLAQLIRAMLEAGGGKRRGKGHPSSP